VHKKPHRKSFERPRAETPDGNIISSTNVLLTIQYTD
jgi:hypothetical protein